MVSFRIATAVAPSPPPDLSPKRGRLGLVLPVLAAILLVVAGLLISLPYVVDLPRVQAFLQSEASRRLGRPVGFDRVSLSYWPLPAIRVRRLTVGNATGFGPDPLVSVEDARVRVRLLPLLRGRLQFGEVTLARPRLIVEQRRDGTWNLPAPGTTRPAPPAPFVFVSRIRLRDGHVEVRLPGEPGRPVMAHLVDRIDVTLEGLGWSEAIKLRLAARLPGGGLGLKMEGQVGPLGWAGSDLAAVPARLAARFTAEESRPPANAAFVVTGRGEGEVHAEGTLGHMTGGGRLTFARLTITHRPAACPSGAARSLVLEAVELPIRIDGTRLTVQPFTVRVAGGTVRGEAALTWRGATPGVRLSGVRVQAVAAEPVLVDFFCQPYAIAGRVDASGEATFAGTGDELLRSARGTWQARVGPGRLMGPAMLTLLSGIVRVGTALSSVVTLGPPAPLFGSPLEFQSLVASGSVGGGQLRVREMTMQSRPFRVTGDGSYGLLDTRLDLTLQVRAGRSAFGVRVGGTAREPSYAPLPRGILGGAAETLRSLMGARKGRPGALPPAGGTVETR